MNARRLTAKISEIFGLDRRSLALFRVGLGVLLVADVLKRSLALRAHYTSEGLLPRPVALEMDPDFPLFHVFLLSDRPDVQALLLAVAAISGLCVALGYRTRLATVLSLLFVVSIQRRNPLVCHTGDTLLKVLTLWATLLPLGRTFSLDRRRRPDLPPLPQQVTSIATAGLIVQIAVFYVAAGLLKHQEELWTSAEALNVFFRIEEYVTPIGAALAPYDTLNRGIAVFTLVLEGIAPFFLFCPLFTQQVRTALVALFVGFHLGIQLTVYIGIFEILSIVAVCALLPTWFWDSLLPRVPFPARLRTAWSRWRSTRARLPETPTVPAGKAQPPTRAQHLGRASAQGLAAAALSVVLLSNWKSVEHEPVPLPPTVRDLAAELGLIQNWTIFTALTKKFQGWFLVVAQLEDGTLIDLLRRQEFRGVAPPKHWAKSYPNHNMRRFYMNMAKNQFEWTRPHYARWLAREWREHDGRRIVHMAVFQVGNFPGREGKRLLGLLNPGPRDLRADPDLEPRVPALRQQWEAFLARLGSTPIEPG